MDGKKNDSFERSIRRKPPCTLLHTADQARKVVLRNRWSGIVLGYRRVSAQNCPSFPCSASRSRSRVHWFECAGSWISVALNTQCILIVFVVHFYGRSECDPLESMLDRFDVSFDTRMTTRPRMLPIGLIARVGISFTSNNSGVCFRV